MSKRTIEIRRLSSFTLLKIMLITGLFPWVLVDTGIILYHLISGDYVVNYHTKNGAQEISIGLYVLLSYPLFVLLGCVFVLLFWLPCAFSLWLWSKVRSIQMSFYELDAEEI